MATKPYLIFSLHNTRYAISAQEVREIFLLPELTPVADAPNDVVGLLNLHSVLVPVMHLDLRFGHKFDRCNLTDSVIVLESQELQVGVIVHQVETVNEIDDQYIQMDLNYGRAKKINQAFIGGVINLDDEMIMILEVDGLVRHSDALEALVDTEDSPEDVKSSAGNFYKRYFPAADSNVKQILSQRAINLGEAVVNTESSKLISVAMVKINGNYFGLDLGIVREFTKIGRVTIIPCCPSHIMGNMNLRGEILTLIDIRQPLNLNTVNHQQATKAVVVEVDDIVAGITVEEVLEVVDFRPEEIKPIPLATDTDTAEYLKGMVNILGQPLNIIDLPKLLTQGAVKVELTA